MEQRYSQSVLVRYIYVDILCPVSNPRPACIYYSAVIVVVKGILLGLKIGMYPNLGIFDQLI